MSIQKCKPGFDLGNTIIKRAPFTQLYNKVLQTCTNMEAVAVWAYLQSQIDDWQLNPSQLKKHFKVGKNKIYKILSYMIDAHLLVRNVQIAQNGRRISTTYIVLDGTEFLEPTLDTQGLSNILEESHIQNTPLPQNREVENREMENRDIKKERSIEKKDFNKDINNISASDDAPANEADSFNTFWDIYPVKKNKVRAKKIWERKKLNNIAVLICNDVSTRQVNDASWSDEQYIPHPSTYLQNERWKDSVSTNKRQAGKGNGGDALSRVISKHLNKGVIYDHGTGNTVDPLR